MATLAKPSFGLLRTLRGRLTLLACLATLPAFLFVLFVATRERGAALRRAESEARYVGSLASREHAHQVQGAQRLLDRLGTLGGGPPIEALDRSLPAILSGLPQFANLGILEPDGRLRFSVVPPARPVDMRENPAFQRAMESQDVAIGRYQIGQIVRRPVLILAKALRRPGRSAEGVLFAALDLTWLDQLARQARLPEDCTLLILDREGRILARSSGPGVQAWEEGDLLPSFPQMARAPSSGLVWAAGRDRVQRLYTAAPMDGLPDLYVAVGLRAEAVIGTANRAFTRALWALAALTLLTVASSIAAADLSVLRDARLLARATRRFGAGDLEARAPVPSAKGEIQDLAMAFNGMAEALERRQHEAMAAEERMRALTRRLHAVREEEGERISRELHDQLGQELTALKLDLSQAKRSLLVACPSDAVGEVGRSIDQILAQVDGCVDSVRRISSELRPSVLDRLGLGPALEWLAREFERRTGLTCAFSGGDLPGEVPAAAATALFRITQEALTNVARHADARSVRVDLARDAEGLALEVQDDGRGFDTSASRPSLGLLGMGERARMVGGRLELASAPGKGTIVRAAVPLPCVSSEEAPC